MSSWVYFNAPGGALGIGFFFKDCYNLASCFKGWGVKKIILSLIFVFQAVVAQAQEPTLPSSHPFYIGVGTGVDLPASGFDPVDYVGGGADFFGGVRMNQDWSAQVDIADWSFIGGDRAQYHFRFLAQAKYTFPGMGWQPYLLAGPGLSLRTFYFSGASASNLDLEAGAGVQVDLGGDSHLFVQAQLNSLIDTNPKELDVPLTAGLWVGL
jgi:hypothetical protein